MAYNKYYVYKEQVSRDNGLTWSYTGNETASGSPIATYDTLAECEGGTFDGKLKAIYSDGRIYNLACDGDVTLTSGNTSPSGYETSAMTSAVVGQCVTYIGWSAFDGFGGLTSITIPSNVTWVSTQSFNSCTGLTSVNIPDSVTIIGNSAFRMCSNLTSATIGSGITSIGSSTFQFCSKLTSVTIKATTPPSLGNQNAFEYTSSNLKIYVPSGSVSAYKAAEYWSEHADKIQAIP